MAVDPHTVKISLGEVYFLNDWQLGGISPIPRHYYDPENLLDGHQRRGAEPLGRARRRPRRSAPSASRSSSTRASTAVRSGPGALVLEDPARDYVTGEKIELRHRDGYFAPGEPLLGDPWVDRVVYRVINDFDAALAARKAGAVDFMGLRPVQYLKQTNDPRFDERSVKHVDRAGSYTYSVGTRSARSSRTSACARRSRTWSTSSNVCDKLLLGLADPVESPIYPGRPEYNSQLAPWPLRSGEGQGAARRSRLERQRRRRDPRQGDRRRARAAALRDRLELRQRRPPEPGAGRGRRVQARGHRRELPRDRLVDPAREGQELRLRRGDPGLDEQRHDAAGPVPDLALVAGGARRLEPHLVQERRGRQAARGVPRRVRRGQAQGAVRPRAGDPLRRAALHLGVRAEVTHAPTTGASRA